MIEKSRRHRAKLEAERRRNRWFRRAAVVALALAAVVVLIFWQRSEYQRRKVEINNAYNEGRLQVATDPTLGLQKMKAACLQASLDSAKWRGYYTLLHQHLTYEVLLQQTDTALLKAAFSADGRTFSTTAGDGVRIYHTGETQPFQRLFLANNTVHELYFQGNDTLWSGAQDRITYAWAQGRPLPFFEPIGGDLESSAIQAIRVSSDGQWLCTAHHDAYLTLWSVASLHGRAADSYRSALPGPVFFARRPLCADGLQGPFSAPVYGQRPASTLHPAGAHGNRAQCWF